MALNIFYDKDCDLSIIQGKKLPSSVMAHKVTRTRLTSKTAAWT